ncbi:NarK/NasA family nitrate transporter [Streptomyces sp. B93]|uniref:nitrate/nitrite transporter n=1 Tax=Streptomyces sp. B93 TaxID=2824875 RepID=UPI001B37A6D9|nr:nitrate/nitrite transporter [Streptomyces sp. B93]MBQ1092985.1 NarK/NasA family nitrate transporter [Streptomyces sp. B93]
MSSAPRRAPRTPTTGYDPEQPGFWNGPGKRIARRNLVLSILTEHIGFSVWSIWSVLVLFMSPETGLDFTPGEKLLLIVTPTVVGALLRVPYSRAVLRFGGRTWTVATTAVLLVPTALAWHFVQRPGTPLWVFLVIAALSGSGGGNFGSSMTNIALLYPRRHQGWALGVNAGGGNLGVALVQVVGVVVIATAGDTSPSHVAAVFLPLIVLATLLAALGMDDLGTGTVPRGVIRGGLRHPDTWWISLLYVGTFGSFIGYGFAFGVVLQTQFGSSALQAASFAALGPLLGSFARPLGGWLADRWGGARVTTAVFGLMGAGTAVLLVASAQSSVPLFITAFSALFVLTGAGNGSVYRMIPSVFARETRAPRAQRLTAAAIGITGAVGALGGAGVNLVFRAAYDRNGSGEAAFWAFLLYYAVCALAVWARYLRPGAGAADGAPRTAREREALHV